MARLARALALPPTVVFGAVWKTCAREPFMQGQNRKKLMLSCLDESFEKAQGQVDCYAVVVVKDRYFMAASLNKDHTFYSRWVKWAHYWFAREVNAQTMIGGRKRVGPVGRCRPNTCPVDGVDEFKRLIYAMAYAPVVSGEVKRPEDCRASTYNLYAGGKVDPRIKNIRFPQWYWDMGLTMKQRQRAFRNECRRWYEAKLLDDIIDDLNKGFALGGDAYRKRMSDYRKKVRDLYVKRVGRLIDLTLRYGFQPTIGHAQAAARYGMDLVADLVAHVVWAEGP